MSKRTMVIVPDAKAGVSRALRANFPAMPPRLPDDFDRLLDQLR